jgi:serine/threonine protein kinase
MPEHTMNSLPIGTVVHDRYRILATVGHGGLGTVYQVADILFGKGNIYALKELIDQSPGARKQFEMESQWLQSLDHNHIPKVREHFEWYQRLYLVMDFVDGENLEQRLVRLAGRPFSEDQALRLIAPICEVLQYLHTRVPPILHRDVKPSNIIVTPGGHVVLVDLGIAKAHLPGANQTSTFVRKAGTEGYAPPEQYTASGQAGPWSDVYSLGATLYQLLTGRVPPTAVERLTLDANLAAPQQVNPAISPWVSSTLLRSLALRPSDRFQSVKGFADALKGPAGRIAGTLSPDYWSSREPPSYTTPAVRPPSITRDMAQASPPFSSSTPGVDPSSLLHLQTHTPPGASITPPPSPPMPLTPPVAISKPAMRPATSQLAEADRRALLRLKAEINATTEQKKGRDDDDDDGDDGGDPNHPKSGHEAPHSRLRSPWTWGIAACGFLAVVVLIGGILFYLSAPPDRSSPKATATGYFAALQAQNYDLAWQYSAATYTDATSESSFVASLRSDDAQLGRVSLVDVSHMSIIRDSSGSATVHIGVVRADSPNSPVTYTLVLQLYNGSLWLIANISAS